MTMTVIRKADIVASIPDRWAERYQFGMWHESIERKTRNLLALKGTDFTAEQCEEIIGNDSWTKFSCSECGKDETMLVHIGDKPDYEARWVEICPECLSKAIGMLPND